MTTHEPPHDAPRRFGRYVLLDRIGAGGMAEVFRARTYGPGGFFKEVAVKQILTTLLDDRSVVSMFVDEARVTAFLNHPNIVQVVDLGDVDRRLYIAMEFVSGKDLLDILAACARRSTRLSLEHALLIVTSVLAGLDYAHNAVNDVGHPIHVVHRDVSPSNILVGYNGHVKIGDFGIAKSGLQSTRTDAGTQKGKLGYMSPEQVTGDKLDGRADLYSLGVVFYKALTGEVPYDGATALDIGIRHIKDPVPRLPAHLARFQPLIDKFLEKPATRRFQSGAEVVKALEEAERRQPLPQSVAKTGTLGRDTVDELRRTADQQSRTDSPASAASANGRTRLNVTRIGNQRVMHRTASLRWLVAGVVLAVLARSAAIYFMANRLAAGADLAPAVHEELLTVRGTPEDLHGVSLRATMPV
jgi:serine/threonine protein kinase